MKHLWSTLLVVCWMIAPTSNGDASEPIVATFQGHKHTVACLAFASDSKALASGGKDGSVILWDVASVARALPVADHKDMVTAVAFTSDGKTLASCSHADDICVWETATGKRVGTLRGHEKDVRGLAFSHDGKLLASGGVHNTVRLWACADGKALVRSINFEY